MSSSNNQTQSYLSNAQTPESDCEEALDATGKPCKMSEEEIDYNVMGSFPASDPPSWTLGMRLNKQPRRDFEGEKPSIHDPTHQNEPPSINAAQTATERSE